MQKEYRGSQTLTFYEFKSSNIQEKKTIQAGHLTVVQAKDQFILRDSLRNGRSQAFFGHHLLSASHDPLAGGTTLFRMAKVGQRW